jgi:uncharacterized protein
MALLTSLAAAVLGGLLFHKLGVPAGAMIGSMLGVAAVRIVGLEVFEANTGVKFAAYVAIGWVLSQGIDRALLVQIREAAVPIATIVLSLLLLSWVIAAALWGLGYLDPMTALLSTAPGGIAHMGVLGAEMDANVGLITSIHILRISTVLVMAPIAARFLT